MSIRPLPLTENMLEAMPGGVVHVGSDGSIRAANAEALRILGLSYDAITERYTQDWNAETVWENGEPCPTADYPVTRALATGEPQAATTIGVRRPDGTISWGIFSAMPIFSPPDSRTVAGAIVSIIDITERKRADAALQKSESMLRSVVESAPNAITATDTEGRMLFLTKSPVTYPLGRPAWDFVVPEDRDTVKAAFEAALRTGQIQAYEARGISGTFWRTQVGPRYEGDRVVGATFVAVNATEQRALETRVAIADRMASIGMLAAGVAHEVNNPLTYVLANVEWAAKHAQQTGDIKTKERLDAALEGIARIRSVVSDLSTFSHVDTDRRRVVDVHPIIEASLRMAQTETRYRARVVRRFGVAPTVLASEARLGQVFLNLVVNAAQSFEEGEADRNEIGITTGTDESGHAVVEVSDTGRGVPSDLMERIFDPFVTTKPRGVGTGLGLYICRNIVTSLGGELTVANNPGPGARFRVVLPAAEASVPSSVRGTESPSSFPRPLRILVVDDEVQVARVVKQSLTDHEVDIVTSGREAIARMHEVTYDAVVCDLIMPDLTGMDVHAAVLERDAAAARRMVFMTGGPFTPRARTFLESLKNPILQKPFRAVDVRAALAHVLSGVAK